MTRTQTSPATSFVVVSVTSPSRCRRRRWRRCTRPWTSCRIAKLFAATDTSRATNSSASKIAQHDYRDRGIEIANDEIFLSDGSKPDCGFILDILGHQNKIAITDPVYPVYVDTNVMAGHTGAANKDGRYEGLVYLPCKAENGFVPEPPAAHADLVYLCFPE